MSDFWPARLFIVAVYGLSVGVHNPSKRFPHRPTPSLYDPTSTAPLPYSEMGARERADPWESVFAGLLERGMEAEAVELGVMDGLPGLETLFTSFFSPGPDAKVSKTRQGQRLSPSAQKGAPADCQRSQ